MTGGGGEGLAGFPPAVRRPAFRAFLLVLAGLQCSLLPLPWLAALVPLTVALAVALRLPREDSFLAAGLFVSGWGLGISAPPFERVASTLGEGRAHVTGVVCRLPRAGFSPTWDVQLLDSRGKATGLCLRVSARESLAVALGDTVVMTGVVRRLQGPKNPGETNWSALMCRRGIVGRMRVDQATVRPSRPDAHMRTRVRARIYQSLQATMPRKPAGLALAMLVGIRDLLDAETVEDFREAGVVHVLAISGFHVGIVAALFYGVSSVLLPGYRLPSVVSLLSVMAYVLLIGPYAPVVRAGIMAGVVLLGTALHRRPEGINSVGVAGLAVVASRPLWAFEPGFQLSFAATLGILAFGPLLLRGLRSWPPVARWLGACVITSLGAQLGVFPFIVAWFRELPIYALIANVPAVVLATGTIGFSMATSLLASASPVASELAGRVASWSAQLLIHVAERVSSLPHSTVPVGSPAVWAVTVAWAAAMGARAGLILRRPLPWALGGAGLAAALWVGWSMTPWEQEGCRVVFLHVPAGNSIVLEDSGTTLVVDAGSEVSPDLALKATRGYLRFRRKGNPTLAVSTGRGSARSSAMATLSCPVVATSPQAKGASPWGESPRREVGGWALEALGAGSTALDGLVIRSPSGWKVLVCGEGGWKADVRCAAWAAVESTDVLYVGPTRTPWPSHLLLRRSKPRLVILGGRQSGEAEALRDLAHAGFRAVCTSEGAVVVEGRGGEVRWWRCGRP